MRMIAASCLCCLLSVVSAAAQTHPESLATLFEDVYGPNGLVLNSDDVQLDGTKHAAHFNSAFQSDFRLVNIALTSQLAGIPLPSPASGFHLQVRFRHGHVRAVDEQLRSDPLGSRRDHRPRAASPSASPRSSSPSITSTACRSRTFPAVFRHDDFQTGGGRADVVSTANTIQATRESVRRRADLRHHRSRRRVAGGTLGQNAACRCSRTRRSSGWEREPPCRSTTSATTSPSADMAPRTSTSSRDRRAGSAICSSAAKATLMREGTRALAAGVDVRLPTGDEQNLLGAGAAGVRPFAAFSASYRRVRAARQHRISVERRSVLAGDVHEDVKAPTCPTSFTMPPAAI